MLLQVAAALREMRRVEEEMRKRERVEEEKRRAEEIKNSEQEAERIDELQIEKDEKYVTWMLYYAAIAIRYLVEFCFVTDIRFNFLISQTY